MSPTTPGEGVDEPWASVLNEIVLTPSVLR